MHFPIFFFENLVAMQRGAVSYISLNNITPNVKKESKNLICFLLKLKVRL